MNKLEELERKLRLAFTAGAQAAAKTLDVDYHDVSAEADGYIASLNLALQRPDPQSDLIEQIAQAIGLDRFTHYSPPLRWPASPEDIYPDTDGTHPLTWSYAESCRHDAKAALWVLSQLEGLDASLIFGTEPLYHFGANGKRSASDAPNGES